MSFKTCTMTGVHPRLVDFKSDVDFKKEIVSLNGVKKDLEKRLKDLCEKESRINAILEAYARALPNQEKVKLLRLMTEFIEAEIPEEKSCWDCPVVYKNYWGKNKYKDEYEDSKGMKWKSWEPDPTYCYADPEYQKYYSV